jgi:hypothetical protein
MPMPSSRHVGMISRSESLRDSDVITRFMTRRNTGVTDKQQEVVRQCQCPVVTT